MSPLTMVTHDVSQGSGGQGGGVTIGPVWSATATSAAFLTLFPDPERKLQVKQYLDVMDAHAESIVQTVNAVRALTSRATEAQPPDPKK